MLVLPPFSARKIHSQRNSVKIDINEEGVYGEKDEHDLEEVTLAEICTLKELSKIWKCKCGGWPRFRKKYDIIPEKQRRCLLCISGYTMGRQALFKLLLIWIFYKNKNILILNVSSVFNCSALKTSILLFCHFPIHL